MIKRIKAPIADTNLIVPRPQESFNKYQRKCPFHEKARCGRCFCKHPIKVESSNNMCTKNDCPFFNEAMRLLGAKKKKRNEYYVPRRYKKAIII